ncbi:MAG: hypothetical protein ACJASL_003475 [Paraglaciecola sp.]|jgi:hypothetical protein
MGDIFARREGYNPELPAILTGSHLDTQPTGGRFDGVYGVLTRMDNRRSECCFVSNTEQSSGNIEAKSRNVK